MPVTSENVRRHRSKNRVSLVSFGPDGPSPVGSGVVDDVEGDEEGMRQRLWLLTKSALTAAGTGRLSSTVGSRAAADIINDSVPRRLAGASVSTLSPPNHSV